MKKPKFDHEFFTYEINRGGKTRIGHGFRIKADGIVVLEKIGFSNPAQVARSVTHYLGSINFHKGIVKLFQDRKGVVYFIGNRKHELVKIGCSKPGQAIYRVNELQPGCPFKLKLLGIVQTDDRFKLERELHRKFANLRVRGEWFRYTSEIESFLDQVKPVGTETGAM